MFMASEGTIPLAQFDNDKTLFSYIKSIKKLILCVKQNFVTSQKVREHAVADRHVFYPWLTQQSWVN